jgi:hypothetical protein
MYRALKTLHSLQKTKDSKEMQNSSPNPLHPYKFKCM